MFNRLTKISVVTALALALAMPAAVNNAEAVELGVQADYWMTKLAGTVKSDFGGVMGDKIDLKEDLGMSDKNAFEGMLYLQGGRHRLTLRYTPLKYTGSQVVTQSFAFNGQTYSASSKVDSIMEFNQTDIQYTYWLVNMKTGARLGLIGAVKNVNARASLKAAGINEEQSFSLPIPMVGASFELGLGDLVRITATGVGVSYSGNSLLDVTAALEVSPVPLFGITAGFRGVYLNVDAGDTEVKLDTTGLFVGVFAHF